MCIGKYLGFVAIFIAAASTGYGKIPPPKKILGMIKNGYATATSSTITASTFSLTKNGAGSSSNVSGGTLTTTLQSNVYSTGATLNLSGSNPGNGGPPVYATTGSGVQLILTGGTGSSTNIPTGPPTIVTPPGTGTPGNPGGSILIGGGTLDLTSTNTYTGSTGITSGTIHLGGPTGSITPTGPITMDIGSATLNLPSTSIGQNYSVTLNNNSAVSYLLGMSNGTSQTLSPGSSLAITGTPYVTSISPVSAAISN